ncbi:MAG: phenolic acid decarboxylase subunit B, partial [Desulfovibrio sp.]|uniref:flavoprotein n=1 Tax=Desulfovibrio sp. TaxID=885 RepID=UPI00345C023A|nr:phenolic acid decarboxylase subunit B [Desulfovibrio sp.]
PRETPLNLIHLDNMRRLAAAGAVIMPFMPAFYAQPRSLDDLMRHFCGRLLDQIGLQSDIRRWRDTP